MLADRDMNINELSLALGLAQPRGMQKRCRRLHERILVEMEGHRRREDGIAEIEVPIRMFTQVESVPTCGLATREKMIGLIGRPVSFFMPERANAEIL